MLNRLASLSKKVFIYLKSTTCLNSGDVEYSPPIAESVSDCGDEVGLERVGEVGEREGEVIFPTLVFV